MKFLIVLAIFSHVIAAKPSDFCVTKIQEAGKHQIQCFTENLDETHYDVHDTFNETFLIVDVDIEKYEKYIRKLCGRVSVSVACEKTANKLIPDECRSQSTVFIDILERVVEYFCSDNMNKALEVTDNYGVRTIYNNKLLMDCISHSGDLELFSSAEENKMFCQNWHTVHKCMRDVFESSANQNLKAISNDMYEMVRDAMECDKKMSLAITSSLGYRLFSLTSVNRVDEIFCSNNEEIKITERLFSSSLVVVVTANESNKLKVCHFKKGTEICNYSYPSEILSVKLNRSRLVVCLKDSLYIHNIRDMKLLHSIQGIYDNLLGLCTLSLNSHLAYPISSSTGGELQIFDAGNLITRIKIKAHDSQLSAIDFSPNGNLIATASEKGTVIRVFCVKNGQKVHEFRRGVKRQVKIASLKFSYCANYLCVSSNTETVHIFKIDLKALENAERQSIVTSKEDLEQNSDDSTEFSKGDINQKSSGESKWMFGLITKAVSSYFPTQVSDVFSQDRAFATIQLPQSGLKHECVIAKLEKETKLLVACEDGFLYIYDFDTSDGGVCKLRRAHDLRSTLHDITEIDMSGNDCDKSFNSPKKLNSGSYAGVLRGKDKDQLTESDKYRELHEATDIPTRNIFDDVQFPPISATAVRAAE